MDQDGERGRRAWTASFIVFTRILAPSLAHSWWSINATQMDGRYINGWMKKKQIISFLDKILKYFLRILRDGNCFLASSDEEPHQATNLIRYLLGGSRVWGMNPGLAASGYQEGMAGN